MRIGLLTTLFALSAPVMAQQHKHGEAEAFIAEQDGVWEVSFRIPAYDALGFEYQPQTDKEKQTVTSFIALTQKDESMVILNGNCSLQRQSLTLPDYITLGKAIDDHDEDHHDEHEHDHDEEHDEDHHDEHGHEHDDDHDEGHHDEHEHHDEHDEDHHDEHEHHDEHGDIELTHTYQCKQGPDSLRFTLMDNLAAVQKIEVQWFTAKGQGAKTLSKNDTILSW